MQSVLFDTSAYISILRRGSGADPLSLHLRAGEKIWMSAVVLEELYAGTTPRNVAVVEALEREFEKLGRILLPSVSDWAQAGRALSQLAAKYDYEQIGRGRLTNDALIAISAGRKGVKVITAHERDFRRLAEFYPFEWQVG